VAEAARAMVTIAARVDPEPGWVAPYVAGYARFTHACRVRGYIGRASPT
jgi:hypothetical protein